MANFNTHFTLGTTLTGMAASLCHAAELASLPLCLALWGLGTLGSLLPDIDSDNSTVLKLLFNGLGLVAMAFTLFWLAPSLKLPQLWLALLLVFVMVRFPLMYLFQRFSRHRGLFHSQLAALFFGLLVCWFSYHNLQQNALVSWLAGTFITLGYLIHLVLDECFSVDLSNATIKRSFGTAMKLLSIQYYGRSALMVLATVILLWHSPPLTHSWQTIAGMLQVYFTQV